MGGGRIEGALDQAGVWMEGGQGFVHGGQLTSVCDCEGHKICIGDLAMPGNAFLGHGLEVDIVGPEVMLRHGRDAPDDCLGSRHGRLLSPAHVEAD